MSTRALFRRMVLLLLPVSVVALFFIASTVIHSIPIPASASRLRKDSLQSVLGDRLRRRTAFTLAEAHLVATEPSPTRATDVTTAWADATQSSRQFAAALEAERDPAELKHLEMLRSAMDALSNELAALSAAGNAADIAQTRRLLTDRIEPVITRLEPILAALTSGEESSASAEVDRLVALTEHAFLLLPPPRTQLRRAALELAQLTAVEKLATATADRYHAVAASLLGQSDHDAELAASAQVATESLDAYRTAAAHEPAKLRVADRLRTEYLSLDTLVTEFSARDATTPASRAIFETRLQPATKTLLHDLDLAATSAEKDTQAAVASVASGVHTQTILLILVSVVMLVASIATPVLASRALLRPLAAQSRLGAILRASDVSIATLDPGLRVVTWNAGAEKLHGYTAEEMIGRSITILMPEGESVDQATIVELMSGSGTAYLEIPQKRRDGSLVEVALSIVAMNAPDGSIAGFTGVAHDISDRRAAERAKAAFLTAVSHELRTPLTSVLGFSKTLHARRRELTEEQTDEIIARLASSAHRLDELMADLIDVQQLAAEDIRPDRVPTDLVALVNAVVRDTDLGHRRMVVLPSGTVTAEVEPRKIERVVRCLLDNAERYSPADTPILVAIEHTPEGAQITVADQGAGVPEAIREKIFAPLYQGPSTVAHSPGMGIGLAMVARLVRLHDGRAWVEDRPGGGSLFRVLIPT